ncbi:MAG: double zinc ribbon domain-containing protein [Treponema sp.]|uniref:double zinc ribbon domain-containing protein n=1 Tax=Treponema sp. TaxID=166 RepID=UPI003FA319CB
MNKHPKFFCENCKEEVRRDAMICPHCGRFFASVRCPECGFTGTHKEFKKGCPSCGYAFSSDAFTGAQENSKQKKAGKALRYSGDAPSMKSSDPDPLPLWIYGLVLLLGTVLAAIFYLY